MILWRDFKDMVATNGKALLRRVYDGNLVLTTRLHSRDMTTKSCLKTRLHTLRYLTTEPKCPKGFKVDSNLAAFPVKEEAVLAVQHLSGFIVHGLVDTHKGSMMRETLYAPEIDGVFGLGGQQIYLVSYFTRKILEADFLRVERCVLVTCLRRQNQLSLFLIYSLENFLHFLVGAGALRNIEQG